jgi:hypothetical protein
MTDLAWFWAYAFWYFGIKLTWDSMPGPVWVKVLLVTACVAMLGPQDEIVLMAILALCRRIRARKERKDQE